MSRAVHLHREPRRFRDIGLQRNGGRFGQNETVRMAFGDWIWGLMFDRTFNGLGPSKA